MPKDPVLINYTIYYDDPNLNPYRESISVESSQHDIVSREAKEWIKKIKAGPFNLESTFELNRAIREPIVSLKISVKATATKVNDNVYYVNMKVDLDCKCRISGIDIKLMDENMPDNTVFDKMSEFIINQLPNELSMTKKNFKSLYRLR